MQVIIPGNRARGAFAYRATTAPHPAVTDQAAAAGSTSMAPPSLPATTQSGPETTSNSSAIGGHMDIDNPLSHHSSSNKRSFASFAMTSESGSVLEVAAHPSAASASDDPAAKRMKAPTVAGKKSAGRAATVKALNQATAVVGMQGSINRLTDIFEQSQHSLTQTLTQQALQKAVPQTPEDRALERKDRALQLLQDRDDGFDLAQKVTLISIFGENPTTIDTYLGLTDSEIRQAWISRLIAKV